MIPGVDQTKSRHRARRGNRLVQNVLGKDLSIDFELRLRRGGGGRRQKLIDSRRKARDFAGGALLWNHTLGRGPVERRGRLLQGRFGKILILFRKRCLDPLDGGSNGREDASIPLLSSLRLPLSLQCRWMIRHD